MKSSLLSARQEDRVEPTSMYWDAVSAIFRFLGKRHDLIDNPGRPLQGVFEAIAHEANCILAASYVRGIADHVVVIDINIYSETCLELG